MLLRIYFIIVVLLTSCKSKEEKIKPTFSSISESVYASGKIKSKNQYQAFSTVSGIIDSIFVTEGDTLKIGTPLLIISNETQKLIKENALLNANFSDINSNQGKLKDAIQVIELSKNKYKNDSLLLIRQQTLWNQHIGAKIDLEQRELAFQNSKTNYYSSILKYNDLKRQIEFSAAQSKKNYLISSKQENDYTVKSQIDGVIYSLNKSKGDFINPQTPLAIIGDASHFILEMQVDEFDILKIKIGQPVLVTLDSYKDEVFNAKVTKIDPLMNERSKTFLIEAEFEIAPKVLYPNISFEANIVIQTKEKVLLIPREYLLPNNKLINRNGDTIVVKTGLKDYQKIEIISGITESDELIKPIK
jgi:multidrug efflux pump subunit AcrA (membrane-fusion protein)